MAVINLRNFIGFLFQICFFISSSDGLKDVLLEGPYYLRQGEDVFLTCQYDMERDQLYAVKWYRGSQEFYRFVPKEVPPQKVFFLRDHPINIDIHHSNSHQILVKNVSFSLSGPFKCVVSAETTFQTLSDEKNIVVVAVGYDPPKLQLDKIGYHPGDKVKANCSIGKTFPRPNITWFLNDIEMKNINPKYNIISTTIIEEENENVNDLLPISTTISQIVFNLPESYLPSKLSCQCQLADVYEEISIKKIQPVPKNYTFIGSGNENGKVNTRSGKSASAANNRVNSVVSKVDLFSLSQGKILQANFLNIQLRITTIILTCIYFIFPIML